MQEYIGFGSLLANPVLDNKFQLSFQTATEGQKPSLCFEPAARPKKIQTIDTWMHAFHISAGLYTSKYPTEGPAPYEIRRCYPRPGSQGAQLAILW